MEIEGSFGRWLYRNHCQMSAVGAFVRQRVLPGAWLLTGGGIASVLLGANLEKSIVVVLTFLMLGIMMIGFAWAFFRRAKVTAVRMMPQTGAVGEVLRYEVLARNDGRGVLREAYLMEAGDEPRPSVWEFLNLREPGEEKRNFFDRQFGYYRWKWLMGRGGQWDKGERSRPLALAAGETAHVGMTLVPQKRGVLVLNDLRVELPDPLGLFQRRSPTLNEKSEILVIPKRYRLPPMNLGGRSELRVGGETASTVRGEGGEFLGLRDYRAGDSLRKIHWKGWAKTGEPVVKEFEEVRFPRYGLVLDTGLSGGGPVAFEEAVSVAASFVSTMERERCLLDLMFVREEPEVFTAGRGVAKPDRLMEILARVKASEESGYDSLRRLVLAHANEMTAGVVVFSGWSDDRREFLGALRSAGLALNVYAVGKGEAPEEVIGSGITWLREDRVQEDLLKG
jgi:uncharacterized protein (DUF58 family)